MSLGAKNIIKNTETSRQNLSYSRIRIVPRVFLKVECGMLSGNTSDPLENISIGNSQVVLHPSSVRLTPAINNNCSPSFTDNTELWSDMTTKQLIASYKKYDKEFSTGIKKFVWDKISNEMSKIFGYQFTSQQCDTK
ncbi:uncharacterized protein LOC123670897 [Harmonia axyridis]|uniref:uncharacterized protein LOC123670897 n=1 Tax=Harmonia axyridis TaxID=115357 RepID=UPI001E2751A8|nr:uncharacterized protein LOC123670897 [Harmonia axyridis]